jgi:hypothetical protein
MANLATATSSDRETVATLTKEISTLIEQLKAKHIWAKSQEDELKCFLGGHVSAVPIAPTKSSASYLRKSYKTKNYNSCWSHGYQVGLAHTSANCTKKEAGHKDAATKDNIMGGVTWVSEFL